MTSHGMPRQRARATQATLHVMRERGVMRGPGGAGARARLVPCVEVSAVVEESLGRVGLAVDRRQVQRGAALRRIIEVWSGKVCGGCTGAERTAARAAQAFRRRRRRGVERRRGRRIV